MFERWMVLAFVAVQAFGVRAQTPSSAVGVRGGYGYLIAHHENLMRMVEGHIPSVEMFFEQRVNGKRDWHHIYKGPSWGIGLMAADLRANELGNAFRVTPYLLVPLSVGEHYCLDLRFGWGVGMVTRPFDRESNYKGHAIGSTFNVNMPLALEYRRRFGNTWIGLGLGIDHFSNGAFKVPNLGINVPTVQLSLRRSFGGRTTALDTARTSAPSVRALSILAYATLGVKETFPVDGAKYPCYAVVMAGTKRISPKFMLEAGLDVFHNTALPARAERLRLSVPDPLTQAGVHFGGGMVLNKLTIVFQAGIYAFNAFPDDGAVFNRFGFRHTVGKRCLLNFTLKTHLATADHFELGFGYRFR